MTVADMQADARRAFVGGGPGALVSGLAWLAAALALQLAGLRTAYAVLFFGGFLIYPLSTVLERAVFRRAPAANSNTLVRLGTETLPAMLGVLAVGWLLLDAAPQLVFPLAAIAVGGRYLVFRTVYGDSLFYALGGALLAVGALSLWMGLPPPALVPWVVGTVEVIAAAVLIVRASRAEG